MQARGSGTGGPAATARRGDGPALNGNVAALAPPPVPLVKGWAAEYDGSAGPLLDLSQAVPDGDPPPALLGALAEAAADPATARYGPIAGETALRRALAAEIAALYGGRVGEANVVVTAGCNQAFVVAALALAGPGETVLVTTPCYFNHDAGLRMLGVRVAPLPLAPEAGFLPDPAALEAAVVPGVKAAVLVSPNNPTGAVYGAERLAALAEVARRRGIVLVLDETYRDFLSPGAGPPHGLFARDDWGDVLVHLYSFSKAYAIPGHRLGAIVAGKGVTAAAGTVMDNLQICAPRIPQVALTPLMEALGPWRAANAAAIAGRADAFRAAFERLPGWEIAAIGAYFAYVRHPFAERDAVAVAACLAAEKGVLTLPGPFFGEGQDGFLRMAFANVGAEGIAALPGRLATFAPAAG